MTAELISDIQTTSWTREQTHEAFEVTKQCFGGSEGLTEELQAEKDMVSILSLVAKQHQQYVSSRFASVAVEIDGHKFMLSPRQLVPQRAKILTSNVRASDNGNGKQISIPVGFGVVAGGSQ